MFAHLPGLFSIKVFYLQLRPPWGTTAAPKKSGPPQRPGWAEVPLNSVSPSRVSASRVSSSRVSPSIMFWWFVEVFVCWYYIKHVDYTILYDIILYYTILYYIVSYYIILYYILLYYIILYPKFTPQSYNNHTQILNST